jgi:hypothetical protein
MANWNSRKWVVLAAALVVLIAGLAVVHSYLAPEPRAEPLPSPNGYDDFVAAGGMLRDFPTNESAENLRRFISNNRAALDRAHLGLTRSCRIPRATSPNAQGYWGRRLDDLSSVKKVALALVAKGNLAEMEGKPMEAAEDYVGGVKLGMDVVHGGVVIDALVAAACEAMGTAGLKTIVPKLDGAQSREILEELQKLEASRETKQDILKHEEMFARRTAGFRYVFYELIKIINPAYNTSLNTALAKYDAQLRRTKGLEWMLALRAFELEKGRKAQGWGDLVPDYLKETPKDPGTDKVLPWPPR